MPAESGSITNPIPQDFLWCEVDTSGHKTWYTNRNGGKVAVSDVDGLEGYVPFTGGQMTGNLLLPDHPLFDAIPDNAAISKADVVGHELQVQAVSVLPDKLERRKNTLYLIIK